MPTTGGKTLSSADRRVLVAENYFYKPILQAIRRYVAEHRPPTPCLIVDLAQRFAEIGRDRTQLPPRPRLSVGSPALLRRSVAHPRQLPPLAVLAALTPAGTGTLAEVGRRVAAVAGIPGRDMQGTMESTEASPMTFAELGLPRELLEAVRDAGYTEPTPIQRQAIPCYGDALTARQLFDLVSFMRSRYGPSE